MVFKPAPGRALLWLETKEGCFSFCASAAVCGSAACAASWGRKPLPSVRVLLGEQLGFGSSAASEGSLSSGKCAAASGLGAAWEETTATSAGVVLKAQLCQELGVRSAPTGQAEGTEQCLRAGPCWQTKKAHLCPFCLRSALPEKPTPFQYPPGWPPLQELPPSLRAPPPGGWPVPPGLQWG